MTARISSNFYGFAPTPSPLENNIEDKLRTCTPGGETEAQGKAFDATQSEIKLLQKQKREFTQEVQNRPFRRVTEANGQKEPFFFRRRYRRELIAQSEKEYSSKIAHAEQSLAELKSSKAVQNILTCGEALRAQGYLTGELSYENVRAAIYEKALFGPSNLPVVKSTAPQAKPKRSPKTAPSPKALEPIAPQEINPSAEVDAPVWAQQKGWGRVKNLNDSHYKFAMYLEEGKYSRVDPNKNEILKEKGFVLVEYGATWCEPCKKMKPALKDYAEKHPQLKIGYISLLADGSDFDQLRKERQIQDSFFSPENIDHHLHLNPKSKRRITKFPTFIVYYNGNPIAEHQGGFIEKDVFQEEELNQFLKLASDKAKSLKK